MAEVVIAARGGSSAKSRCDTVLDPTAREALVEAMLADMLSMAARAPSVTATHVITPTMSLADLATSSGAQVIREAAPYGLSSAFHRARHIIGERRPTAVLALLPGDLPLLAPDELEQAISAYSDEAVVLSPAMDGGTNAIVMRASTPLRFAFGPESFSRHVAAAGELGLEPRSFSTPGLSFDLDLPADITALLAGPDGGVTSAVLRRLLVSGAT